MAELETTYAERWMLRYCDLANWKDAIEYATERGRSSMYEDLRKVYLAIRDDLLCDNRREMLETLDVLFDPLYYDIAVFKCKSCLESFEIKILHGNPQHNFSYCEKCARKAVTEGAP